MTEKKRKVCRFHPDLGQQTAMPVSHRDRPEDVQDMLLCLGCLRESKPYHRPEFAS